MLRNASIVRVERFENGLAPKYVAQLSTKHIVMIKFLANPALLHWFRSPQDWHAYDDDDDDDIASARSCAADRDCVMHCTQQGRARYGRSIDGAC